MKLFNVLVRLALLASIGILGFGCDGAGPVEAPNAPKADAPQLIKLPSHSGLQKVVSVTGRITVKDGGQLTLNTFGQWPYVFATITFPKKAVSEDVDITMTLENQALAFDFDPDGISFNKSASLDVYARGLNLFGIPPWKKVKLFYCDSNGELVEMKTGKVSVNAWTGELSCDNGEIPHFSRYAFGY
jgi:hypothetical protein